MATDTQNNQKKLSLLKYIQDFVSQRVLVVGDIMLDQFTYGETDRLSPEAPVPILKVTHEKRMLGGAGNVAANLRALGCQVSMLSIVGEDANGQEVNRMLEEIGVTNALLSIPDYTTIVKTRYITGGNHLLRVDREKNAPHLGAIVERFFEALQNMVQQADIVLVSDYNKGLLTETVTQAVIETCRKQDKPVIVDPKGDNFAKYAGATLVKPNLKEFTAVARQGKRKPTDENFPEWLAEGAGKLLKQHHLDNMLVTLGEHGMALISSEDPHQALMISTQACEVFDVSGAGDTSLATLGAALSAGASIREAMQLANFASGIVVGKIGTATVTADELADALIGSQAQTNVLLQRPERKIITLDQATEIIGNLKRQGKTIGFTNGAFDCCHMGHISSFINAKALCDVLVVALNSDASVKRYKGENRPIQNESTRSMLLASFEFVDYVIIFDEDTPMHIIRSLKPDVLAKEGYTIEQWPEAQYAQSYGAMIVTLPRLGDYSTTSLVQKMMKNN